MIRCHSRRICDRIFEKFSRPQPFAFEIAPKSAVAPRAAAWPRPLEVPEHYAERRRAAAREIRCGSRRVSDLNFRKFFAAAKFFDRNRAKSAVAHVLQRLARVNTSPRFVNCPQHYAAREIRCHSRRISDRNLRKNSAAAKFCVRNRAEIRCAPRAAAWQQPSGVPKHCAERRHAAARAIRCDFSSISDRNFRKIFAAAKFCDRNRARSRRNSLCPTCCSLATTLTGPRRLCRASACCRRVRFGAVRGEFRAEIFEFFSRPQNFSIEIARNPLWPTCYSA